VISSEGAQSSNKAGAVPQKVQAKAAEKAAKAVATDRTGTAKGTHGAAEAKALAHAKEKLLSGDLGAKFASGLKDFGSFAGKIGKGIQNAEQFLNKVNGALDKTLKGLQDGLQFAEKLGGFENQLKGTFDALTNLVKTGLQLVDSLKAILGGAAPAQAGATGGAAQQAAAGGPGQAGAAGAAQAGAAGGAAQQAAAGGPGQAGAAGAAQGQFSIPGLDWKPDTHKTERGSSGGYAGQTDVRTMGGEATGWKEVTEKQTVIETKSIEKVPDVPPKTQTGKIEFPNAVPVPGQERNVKPQDVQKARDMLKGISAEDLRQPGAKIDIEAFASHRGDSKGYDNKALTDRRAIYTRESFVKALSEKGLSKAEIDKLLPSEKELKEGKSHGSTKAVHPENAPIDLQQSDRRCDCKVTIPGRQEKYTEQVRVPKEIEVKKRVPVETSKPIGAAADIQLKGPGMDLGAHVEVKMNPDGTWDIKTGDLGKPALDMDAIMKGQFGGADPLAAFNQQLSAQQANLGQWANPVNNLLVGALNGNPSAAAFQQPLQQFGQALRGDVLGRSDLPSATRKGFESMAGRLDSAASKTMSDLNALISGQNWAGALSARDLVGGQGPIG
jgi:hypothetical protein